MSWFYNLNILKKLILCFSLVGTLIVGLVAFMLFEMKDVNKSANETYVNWLPSIKEIDNMKLSMARVRASEYTYVLTENEEDLNKAIEFADKKIELFKKQKESYEKLISEPEEKVIYGQLKVKIDSFFNHYNEVISLVRKDEKSLATQKIRKELLEEYTDISKDFDKLSEVNFEGAKKANDMAEKIYENSIYLAIGLAILSIILLIIIAMLVTNSIARPLNKALDLSNKIADGNLTENIKGDYKDETGLLLNSLGVMNENLRNIVTEVRFSVDTIATASSEISSGNMDLSQRTEEQASSLEETASAMEEIASTVKNNAENVDKVKEMSLEAEQLANKSGSLVKELVGTMNEINDSSNKIKEIIGVIDGIAFQTNLLALNAAVEAARAGDAGRGFAVVAGEVRTLSKRSAEAAKEIKELIGNSVEKIEKGFSKVNQAGNSMESVVQSVSNVSVIINDIAIASKEQSNGITEINKAVSQMDQMTQQNAALVEEAAAASASLNDQSNKLAQTVNFFKV